MTTTRLDNVLTRNRRNAILDLAVVAALLLTALFATFAIGGKLPALSAAPSAAEGGAPESSLVVDAPQADGIRLASR